MTPEVLILLGVVALVAFAQRGGPPPPAPGGGVISVFGVSSGAVAAALVGMGSPSRGAHAAVEGAPRTGPASGTHEPRVYAQGPGWEGYAARWPAPAEVAQACLSQTAITAAGGAELTAPAGVVMSDGDGTLWILAGPSGNLNAGSLILTLLRVEHRETGRTIETSQLLWYLDWPRVEREGAGWRVRGLGEADLRSGRGTSLELRGAWFAKQAVVTSHHEAQSRLHPEWQLFYQQSA